MGLKIFQRPCLGPGIFFLYILFFEAKKLKIQYLHQSLFCVKEIQKKYCAYLEQLGNAPNRLKYALEIAVLEPFL